MATSFAQQATLARESPVFQEPQEPLYKRTLDLSLVIGAHLLLLPVFLLFWIGIPLAIWLDDRGPVFYRQPRLGRGGKAFTIIKFRTMVVDAEQRLARDPGLRARFAEAYKLRDDPRVTRVGRWLRGWSLDELPQLVNVLKGEISLVGPRPVVEEELPKYGQWGPWLLSVKPGLTGLWQVLRHDELDYTRRISLDMHYIEHRSLRLDLEILLRTLPSVLARRGAY
ncbi:MAG: hypothetical protein AUI42_08475 [Actinobacteria bacterium 13_1_40CM_2_65_8]|nr:MAG: hypothetical protein AUI42_08475 [Actinobacteria bacterium 13_1_40CM_2_65_8]